MAKVLVCFEHPEEIFEEINQTALEYYQIIKPGITQAGHQVQQVTCSEILDDLVPNSSEVILLLIRSEQSCCWEVARHIREKLSPRGMAPLILILIYWDKASLEPNYFITQEYSRLWDDYSHHFEHRELGGWINYCITRKSFDSQVLEEQIKKLFSLSDDGWSWIVANELSFYILIHLSIHTIPAEQQFTLIWSRDKTVQVLDSWDKYLHLIEQNGLTLEAYPEDIIDLFSSFQRKNILNIVYRPDTVVIYSDRHRLPQGINLSNEPTYGIFVSETKYSVLYRYADIVRPPVFWSQENIQYGKFWTIDLQGGDLEEWLFTQQGEKLEVNSWVREENFVSDFKNCISYARLGDMTSS